MGAPMRHLIRSIAETPFEVLMALLSAYAGVVVLVEREHSPVIPWALIVVVAWTIIVGGVLTLAARFSPRQHIRLERAGLGLLVGAYGVYSAWGFYLLGVTWNAFNGVAADLAIGVAAAIRIRVLGTAVKTKREGV